MVFEERVCLGGREFEVRTKKIYQSNLTSDCWPVQVWGLSYCSGFGDYNQMCEYLATEECGGQAIRKKILAGRFPVCGLPDAGRK